MRYNALADLLTNKLVTFQIIFTTISHILINCSSQNSLNVSNLRGRVNLAALFYIDHLPKETSIDAFESYSLARL